MHVLDVRVFSYSTMLDVIEIENFDHEGELVKGLRKELEKWKDEFTELGFNVTTIVSEGIPFQEILKVADDEKVTMIAVGEKGGGAVERMLLGSTAEKIIRNSQVPVLLVR
jgi:nucleotide-binding universal stress UspA family protein